MRFFFKLFNKLLDFIGCVVIAILVFVLFLVVASIVMVGINGSL